METTHLQLISHTPDQLRALLRSTNDYAEVVGFEIEPELGKLFAQASPRYIERLWSAISPDPWRDGFGMLCKQTRRIVGLCGYTGPPDAAGGVEIAYGVASAYRGKGFATEAARALVTNAFLHPQVLVVRAHTLPESNASARVLEKCAFKRAGEAVDPDEGPVWRWELKRSETR